MANGDCVLGNKNATKIDNLKEDFAGMNTTIQRIFNKIDNLKAWVVGTLITFLTSLSAGLIIILMRKI